MSKRKTTSPARFGPTLTERAARVLGWTPEEALSISFAALRENIRTLDPNLWDGMGSALVRGVASKDREATRAPKMSQAEMAERMFGPGAASAFMGGPLPPGTRRGD